MQMFAYLKRVPSEALERCRIDAEYAKNYLASEQPGTETLCLKESWDALHYLLSTNRRRPAKELDTLIVWDTSDLMAVSILGKEVLNQNIRYAFGAPKWVDPHQAADIAELLQEVEWADLQDEIVPEKMAHCGVYPEGLWDDEHKSVKYLKYWFQRLLNFYVTAAASHQAVICYLKL